jgi:hypothetical protein
MLKAAFSLVICNTSTSTLTSKQLSNLHHLIPPSITAIGYAHRPITKLRNSAVSDAATMPGFDFSNYNRNAALHARGVPLPKATSTGTTIVGCIFEGGVVVSFPIWNLRALINYMRVLLISGTEQAG